LFDAVPVIVILPTGPKIVGPLTVNPVSAPIVVIFDCDAVVILPVSSPVNRVAETFPAVILPDTVK